MKLWFAGRSKPRPWHPLFFPFPSSSTFFSLKINYFPEIAYSRRLLPLRQVRAARATHSRFPRTNPRFFDPCSNSPRLWRGFSNKPFVFSRSLAILATTVAGKKRNSPWQLPNPTLPCRPSRKYQTNPIVWTNPKEPNQMSLSKRTATNPTSLPSRLPFRFLSVSAPLR